MLLKNKEMLLKHNKKCKLKKEKQPKRKNKETKPSFWPKSKNNKN